MKLKSKDKAIHKSVVRMNQEWRFVAKRYDQIAHQISEEEARLQTTLEKLESLNEKLSGLTNAHALSEEAFSALGEARTRAPYGWYNSNSNDGDDYGGNKAAGKHGGRIGAFLLKKIETPRKLTFAEHRKISSTINQIRALATQADTERMKVIELKQRLENLEEELGQADCPWPRKSDRHDLSDTKSTCDFSIRRKPVPNSYSRSDDGKRTDSRIEEFINDHDEDGLSESISIDSALPGRWPDDERVRKYAKTSLEDYLAVRGVGVVLLVWFMIILTFLSAR